MSKALNDLSVHHRSALLLFQTCQTSQGPKSFLQIWWEHLAFMHLKQWEFNRHYLNVSCLPFSQGEPFQRLKVVCFHFCVWREGVSSPVDWDHKKAGLEYSVYFFFFFYTFIGYFFVHLLKKCENINKCSYTKRKKTFPHHVFLTSKQLTTPSSLWPKYIGAQTWKERQLRSFKYVADYFFIAVRPVNSARW